MNGRVAYYFRKAKIKLKKRGLANLLREVISFLWRRQLFLEFLFESIEYSILSRFRDPDQSVIQVFKNETIEAKRVLLYASYDGKSEIGEHVLFQLNAFKTEGYEIVFVTTAPSLPFFEFNKIKDLVSVCVHRQNLGYDFVSWKIAQKFIAAQMSELQSLILMNDSCLGPLYDFGETLKKMRDSADTVYGISKSDEIYPHLQSYFYHFGAQTLKAPVLRKLFDRIRILHAKWSVVRYFEIGTSKLLRRNHIPIRALIDPADPLVQQEMSKFDLTEPTREPLASLWVKMKLSPFFKRSNLKDSATMHP